MYWMTKLDTLSQTNPAMCPNVNCTRKYFGIERKKILKRHLKYECGVPNSFDVPCVIRILLKNIH